MTVKEILNKAVTQALANGWDIFDAQRDKRATWPPSAENVTVTESSDGRQGWDLFIGSPHIYEPIADRWEAEDLLFNIPFAKALWGEPEKMDSWEAQHRGLANSGGKISPGGFETTIKKGWRERLQELAVCEDRFKYLEENL